MAKRWLAWEDQHGQLRALGSNRGPDSTLIVVQRVTDFEARMAREFAIALKPSLGDDYAE